MAEVKGTLFSDLEIFFSYLEILLVNLLGCGRSATPNYNIQYTPES